VLNESLIQKSRQFWKLLVGLGFVFAGFFVMAYGLSDLESVMGVNLALIGMATGLMAFALMLISIHCPECGMRWLWAAVRNADHLQWFNWLVAQRVCPRCGHDPVSR
jgi:hypothetical protein